MGFYTGGKSKAINSPRHLTIRHARRSVAQSKFAKGVTVAHDDPPPQLQPGEEKLNSFWAPGLEAGPEHVVKVEQTIQSPNQGEKDIKLVSKQGFYVDAPQFQLPEGSVYSVYPPPGYPDDHRIIPHIVLSDPHLPWERRGSPLDDDKKNMRNKVPWLILATFTQAELKLAPGALGEDVKQTPTLAVNTTVEKVLGMKNVTSPIPSILEHVETEPQKKKIKDSQGDFIFVKADLFKSLFSTFDDNNKRQVPATPDVNQYKYLSHVRNINTTGMAVAGVEDVGIFSVVVGSRSGPLENPTPESVSVHLLSIEGVEDMKSFPGDENLVALCSLHSWNYTVQPPGMINVYESFVSLGQTLDVLRAPDVIINSVRKNPDKVSQRIADRLNDGYSMVKYRTQTGEQTVALYRGPFTPTTVAPNKYLDKCSNSGQDLQILDREVGMMDVTYSIAWQLGRTLALGDQTFLAALGRFRTAIHQGAMKEAKVHALHGVHGSSCFPRRDDILTNLSRTVKDLANVHVHDQPEQGRVPFTEGKSTHRWHRPRLARESYPALNFGASKIKKHYLKYAIKAAEDLALSKNGGIYDETNDPVSTDWMVILAWVMDRMFLSGIPAHYLISDPSHLEHENLRFFYIDPNWVDCMIDGALSLANHMGEDRDREAIKHIINNYVKHVPDHLVHTPQIPSYGFYLRSDLVTMFPDLKVETLPKPKDGERPDKAPLLRHEIIGDGVMMGLLDRRPGSKAFSGLVFTQPPHQQRFAVGNALTKDEVGVNIRRQYTVSQEEREKAEKDDESSHDALEKIKKSSTDTNNYFVWSTVAGSNTNDVRMIRPAFFAAEQRRILQDEMPLAEDGSKLFDDDTPNSALLAMQLIDPFYNLTIKFDPSKLGSLGSDDQDQALRTLVMTGHSTVKKLVDHDDDLVCHGSEDESEDEDKASESAVESETAKRPDDAPYQRHDSYEPGSHVLKANLAPHVKSIPEYHPVATPSTPSSAKTPREVLAEKDPAGTPTFRCDVYTTGRDCVYTDKDNLPEDLVFSVRVGNTENSNYLLKELDILVPLAPATGSKHRLMEEYDGPGPRMLSNLRFNILTSRKVKDRVQYLVLRLIPRSSSGWIPVKMLKELSFMLCLAKVNLFSRRSVVMTLNTEAFYKYKYEKLPREDSFTIMLVNESIS